MPDLRLDVRQLITLIGHAVDLVGVDDFYHGRRVGMIALKLARHLGWETQARAFIYEAGLLHDCGVSTTREHHRLLGGIHWAGAQAHCILGAARLASFAPLAPYAPVVLRHHTDWTDLPAVCPPEVAIQANLIFLADRIDVLAASRGADPSRPQRIEIVRDLLRFHRGQSFAPPLVDAFLEVSLDPAFWGDLRSAEAIEAFQAQVEPAADTSLIDWPQFREAARLLQEIVDAKSPFTHEHSLGVARLARLLAERRGLAPARCEMIEAAGLLHDLGKLQVPDELLEAPRPLTGTEFDTMRAHSFATLDLLRGVEGLEEITRWATSHHEKLDGSGYPFGLGATDLTEEARIVAVADIYQALAQNRPYRGPLEAPVILAMLRQMAATGAIDGPLVELLAEDPEAYHLAATGGAVLPAATSG
ncbi:MAG TPA: HD domain-containing phosphohydrolase [Holophagaceae bacterium]|nr:HD domain-containing phosphohydrolase [Holophagaceae bacterium]